MRFWIYALLWRWFGRPAVWLIDHDGEEHIRLVRYMPLCRAPYAWRFGLGVRLVYLRASGVVEGPSYCPKWRAADWCEGWTP